MKNLVLSLSVLLFVCCNNYKSENESKEINISLSDKDVIETLPADSIFSKVKYIKLETYKDALISSVDQVIINNDIIYILDTRLNELFLFNISGKFLRKLNKLGSGPGEYIAINDFKIENDKIFILDASSKSLFMYNLNFDFLGKIRFKENYCTFEMTEQYIYLYVGFQSFSLKNISVLDRKTNKIIKKFKIYPKEQLGLTPSFTKVFSKYRNEIFATFPYEYSVYKIDKDELIKVFNVNFGIKNMYPKKIRTLSSEAHDKYRKQFDVFKWPVENIGNLKITKTHFIFSFNFHSSDNIALLNKSNSKYISGYIIETEKFPLARPDISNWSDQKVIQAVTSEIILMSIDGKYANSIPVELSSINEESNPVIAIYELRNEFE